MQFRLRWARVVLDDTDLSAELDETEKEATKPGTFGDELRSRKVAAIRAELDRRAKGGDHV